jgi:GNAT superfamily N-acetyltransferase
MDGIRIASISTGSGTGSSYARWLGAQLEKAGVVILSAERQGAVVGYAYGALEGYDYMALRGPAGVLHDVFVDPQMRQGGIGRALLEAMMDALGQARSAPDRAIDRTAQRGGAAVVRGFGFSSDDD